MLHCQHFELEVVCVGGTAFGGDTAGRSFHVITVTDGAAEISCGGEATRLGRYETALVAGGAGPYRITAEGGGAKVLRTSVPPRTQSRPEP